ncbi:MAG TPA: hypothetical protein DCL16_07775 [Acidimicrobiaceae bacterium]|nr:hypothetical protein [Acidimicrobiaceae bacterium]|tara:strand:- start:219 stop:602 length:384 start_codon:yes stop_codon:yes gene_type:complete
MNGKNSQTASNDDLAAALAQFNNGVTASRQLDKEAKAIAKAEKRRDSAAQKLKEIMDNDADAADRATLEEEYRTAVDEWTRLTNPNTDAAESGDERTVEKVDEEATTAEELPDDPAQEEKTEDQETA